MNNHEDLLGCWFFGLPDTELNNIRRKFNELNSSRDSYNRNCDPSTWEDTLFYSPI